MNPISYKKETETVPFHGKKITVENLTPILTPGAGAAALRGFPQVRIQTADKGSRAVNVDLRSCGRYNEAVSSSVSL